MLTTDEYAKKVTYIDSNLFFDKKYSTIFPKNNMLGPEEDKSYCKKVKKIGDISFEENNTQSENIKNLMRLPPENVTEEWIKSNLNEKVKLLRLENCYWLSKDLISKIGRINPNLKELSFRNLNIENSMIANLVKWAKEIEVLDVSYCDGLTIGFCDILRVNCQKLQCLKVFSLSCINDKALELIGAIDNLIDLDIGLCSQITDTGLITLSKYKIQKLRNLNITGLLKISNKGINTLLNSNNTTLLSLVISLLPQKSVDSDIVSAIGGCKKLNYLDISGVLNINGESLYSVFNGGLDSLESLNMSGINVPDSVAESSLASNKNLKILRLSNNTAITSSLLEYIINNENNLMLLEINRTNPIKLPDSKLKEAVDKRAPNLRIIRATNLFWDIKTDIKYH
jgi:hypothetical protein